jgi:competence protein ComEC
VSRRWLAGRPHHLGLAAFAAGLALQPRAALAAAVALAVVLAAARLPRLSALMGVLLLAGAVIGSARVSAIDRTAARAGPEGAEVRGDAVLLERPRRSQFGSSAVLRLASGARAVARAGSRMRWPDEGEPGTIVSIDGVTKRPARGRSFDWPAYLRRRGILFEVQLDSLRATGRRRGGVAGAIDAARRRAESAIDSGLSRDRAALARGMVLGQDEGIEDAEREDFQRAGLAHVLAVSGQNVMLLCLLALPFLRAARAGPRARVLVPLALIAAYVPLAGAGASLQRAGVMGAAGLIAVGASRPASRWYALELAAAVTLVVNPRVAGDPGWQLSFAAVAGILLLAGRIAGSLSAFPRALADGIAVTLAATLATAPLVAFHFGAVSLAGLVANIAALPIVAPIMWVGMLQSALAQVPGLPAGGLSPFDDLFLRALQALVRAFADAPGARVGLPLRSPAAVAAAYAAVAMGVLACARFGRRAEPRARSTLAAFRLLAPRARIAMVAAAAVLLAVGWVRVAGPPAPPDRLTVRFLDIGQGDATLIQDGAGANVLFDSGPPEARVYRKLRGFGVRQVDLMVSTHQSRDHQGGLHEVLERMPVRAMVENGYGTTDPDYRRLVAEARARGVPVTSARAGQVYRVGRLTITVLGPRPPAPGEPPPDDPNPIGVAAIVSEGDFDLWLSADAESEAILGYPLRQVEAMKVSHHGSADPGLPGVLKRLHPQLAAIEVGAHNSYGHPTPETLRALQAAVPHVYRTDRDGTVSLSVQPDGSERVTTQR